MIYLAFRTLSRGNGFSWPDDWPHALTIGGLALALMLYRPATDLLLPLIYFLYATLLLRLARSGPDLAASTARIEQSEQTHRAIRLTAGLLALGGILEIVVTADFVLYRGEHAAAIVGYMNVPVLFLLGAIVTAAGAALSLKAERETGTPDADSRRAATSPASAAVRTAPPEPDLLSRVRALLLADDLYADSELTLQRLARRAGVPARELSREVNTHAGCNVSQWVNEIRIRAVCEQLRATDCSIGEAMLDSGFSTKSNFNREFRRVTGKTPSEWRRQARRIPLLANRRPVQADRDGSDLRGR